ncbi:MAG TPA: hypothetical protein PKD64_10975 [Pirellulaceae bacterium]|nr:hypothetical protein [Pirellulaceae bacterium]HMO92705.1 hypothetical protein [Pirellulaceae bacterium]HMP70374.1 hypothetical protein [Pirellulaceae bacterium]
MDKIQWPDFAKTSSIVPAKFKKSKSDEPDFKTPVRMVVIWKDAQISDFDKPTTRGIGGRVYFYDAKEKPVRVDGEMIVYAYEDTDNHGRVAADRKYVFVQEEFQNRFSETDLGPSYNVWLPWDKAGGFRQNIALYPVFKSADGKVVEGGHSVCTLSGRVPDNQLLSKTEITKSLRRTDGGSDYMTAQVSHQENMQNREGRLETTTIRVPRNSALSARGRNELNDLQPLEFAAASQAQNSNETQNSMQSERRSSPSTLAVSGEPPLYEQASNNAQNNPAGFVQPTRSNFQPAAPNSESANGSQVSTQRQTRTDAGRQPRVLGSPGTFR